MFYNGAHFTGLYASILFIPHFVSDLIRFVSSFETGKQGVTTIEQFMKVYPNIFRKFSTQQR